jgi:pilus assembly protein Flp/PilA
MFAYTCALVERAKTNLMLLRGDRKGVTALEYGILAGLIGVVVIGGATTLGADISAQFAAIGAKLAALVPA